MPVTSEPRPSSPSRGSGEAVWGSFCPVAFWSAAAFWSAVLAAFWLLEAAFWSADPAVVLAGGFCAVVVLEAAAFWSVVVVLEADGFAGALALSV